MPIEITTLYPWPPLVTLVRTRFDGTVERERMNAAAAVSCALADPANGWIYYSARIEWGDVLDTWSTSP